MVEAKANLFIIAAPSGGGKTSLVAALTKTLPKLEISISHTTRKPRPGEKDGEAYFFISTEKFASMIEDKAFIEHACVFDQYYGTSIEQIEHRLAQGIDVLLDIDWQGAEQIRRLFPNSVSIFIVPPSLAILEQRLQNRKQDSDLTIQGRMQKAREELRHFTEFDYLVINDNFEQAVQDLVAIITANRLSLARQEPNIGKLLSLLLSSE